MARIDILYQKYLETLVAAGLYRSVTAAAEATILKQMEEDERLRLSSIGHVLAKGEADISAGNTITYRRGLLREISDKGKEAAMSGKPVKGDVRP